MKISIIGGAGTLGSAVAFRLGQLKDVTELCLVDVNENLLMNHIMDLRNAYPHQSIYKGNYEGLRGSDIIIITAGVPNRNDIESRDVFLKGNIGLFQQFGENIKKYAPNAFIITASNPVDALNYYLYCEYDFDQKQLLGYTINDSLRFEQAFRDTLNISRDDEVFSPVIGEHGSSQVALFSQVQVNGEPANLNEADKEAIKETINSWFIDFNRLNINRTTGWTTAAGIGRLIEKIISNPEVKTIGSVVLNGEYGISNISLGTPITINQTGIIGIQEWILNDVELKAYQESAEKVKQLIDPFLNVQA